jgi:hypothetical protein
VRRSIVAALGLVVATGGRIVPAQTPPQPGGPAQAPAAAGELRGKVIDMKSEAPIARASLAVRPKGGTALIAGAIASGDGTFRIQGLRPGTYSLRVTFIGFAPSLQEFTITPDAPVKNIGVLKLAQVAVSLSAMAVTEERATVTIEPIATRIARKKLRRLPRTSVKCSTRFRRSKWTPTVR